MMTAWADFLDGRVAAADVVSFAVGGAS
jgi:hypothetical protein